MKQKREPLLIDKVLANDDYRTGHGGVPIKYWESTREHLLLAKRFIFDRDAARYCAEMLRDNPRIVADAQDFAIPPFERTYIETPSTEWFEILTGRKPNEVADTRTGYLIVGNSVRVVAGREDFGGIAHIEYHLHQPWTAEQQVKMAEELGTSRLGLDMFYWGVSLLKFGELTKDENGQQSFLMSDWDKEGLRSLRYNHSFQIHLDLSKTKTPLKEFWNDLYHGSAGDLRNIIGLLLFMNRTSKTRIEKDLPMQPGRWIGRKQRTFLSHRVISFSVNPAPRLLKLAAGEGIKKRLHDCRGHFCHNKIARDNQHDHDWIESPTPSNPLHWICECGGTRWWKKPHPRGSARVGMVTTDYKVTE